MRREPWIYIEGMHGGEVNMEIARRGKVECIDAIVDNEDSKARVQYQGATYPGRSPLR